LKHLNLCINGRIATLTFDLLKLITGQKHLNVSTKGIRKLLNGREMIKMKKSLQQKQRNKYKVLNEMIENMFKVISNQKNAYGLK
jgi:predicted RNA-binding protein with PUA domain